MKKIVTIIIILTSICSLVYSQNVTQVVKGKVIGQPNGEGLIGATVVFLV
jgi:hypothetical protein